MKKFLVIFFIIIIGLFFVFKDQLPFIGRDEIAVNAEAAILIDAESGKILYEKNSKEALPIASMSKMMTQYIVLNAIKNGALDWESTYKPSDYVQQMAAYSGAVTLGMTAGKSYTMKELFTAMTVNSSNDAAVALAEMVSGSEESFVQLMNEQAKSFGLKKTVFYNASGLDGHYIGRSKEETNVATAKEVATIAQKLIERHPDLLTFTEMTNFTTSAGQTIWTTNQMLTGMPHGLAGIDGLKTGYTELAGPCFTATGLFNGKRVISVVMNVGMDGEDKTAPKFELTRALLEHYVLNE